MPHSPGLCCVSSGEVVVPYRGCVGREHRWESDVRGVFWSDLSTLVHLIVLHRTIGPYLVYRRPTEVIFLLYQTPVSLVLH